MSDEITTRKMLEDQLAAHEAYMASSAYRSYLATIDNDILGCEASILGIAPVSLETLSDCLLNHGRLSELRKQRQIFEDGRDVLKSKLAGLTAEQVIPENE